MTQIPGISPDWPDYSKKIEVAVGSRAVPPLPPCARTLEIIEPLADALSGYFYCHGMHGMLLKELKRYAEAREAWNRAIALANTPAEALHIRQLLDRL